ncbi:MAG: DHH family phosphoesterase [Usitatibacter sp.]
MRYYDVFNGDADGICSLHQLRLADPVDSVLVTGPKRDIELLKSVPAGDGDVVTVLDVSLDRNREALEAILARGAVVRYFDHHYAGDIPAHPRLLATIDASGETCTSALVDRYLGGRFRPWAVVGAFGDGLDAVAAALARPLGLDAEALAKLRELGTSINYSAYGEAGEDILVPAAELYRIVSRYADPLKLVAKEPRVAALGVRMRADLGLASAIAPLRDRAHAAAWLLPDAPWARRVIGTFANRLALSDPRRAHAVLAPRADGSFLVSVRTPPEAGPSAVEFCRRFPSAGGRARAAGIDRLERARLEEFLGALESAWAPQLAGAGRPS